MWPEWFVVLGCIPIFGLPPFDENGENSNEWLRHSLMMDNLPSGMQIDYDTVGNVESNITTTTAFHSTTEMTSQATLFDSVRDDGRSVKKRKYRDVDESKN